MLFEQWCQVARANAKRIALTDLASGCCWTFSQLAAEAANDARSRAISFPKGNSARFVLDVLQAWRCSQVVCPVESGQAAPKLLEPVPCGVVHLKTTSATTGTPRLVAFTADQLIADAKNIVRTMGLRPDWPNLGVISLAHSYGFSNLVLPLLLHGIPLVLVDAALPESVRRAAASESDLALAAVPALWRAWHEADAIPPNTRLAISAGTPLPLQLEQEVFAARGLKIHNFYGSSECGGIAYDASAIPRSDAACSGAPLTNVAVAVAPDGCLEVRSAAVGETYWPEADSRLRDGVFHTSDLVELTNGLVYLRGRASDQINVAGRKVAPETIEKALSAHPQVRECLAFGIPSADTERGETIVACLAAKGSVTGESLKDFLGARLPAWQVPREWWLVDSLQPNQRGKLSRAEWRKRYMQMASARA